MVSTAAIAPVSYVHDQPFFVRSAVVIAGITVTSFVQFAARGMVDIGDEPLWVHFHAAVMVSWLGLFVIQNVLATRDIRLHRRMGWIALPLAAAIVVLGAFTSYRSFVLHHNLAGYNAAWALVQEGVVLIAFPALVAAGIRTRRDPQYHRRLMLGATVLVAINPALSRALPPHVSGEPWSGWLIFLVEAALMLFLMRHDRKVLGAVHPATVTIGVAIVICQVLMIELAYSRGIQALTRSMM